MNNNDERYEKTIVRFSYPNNRDIADSSMETPSFYSATRSRAVANRFVWFFFSEKICENNKINAMHVSLPHKFYGLVLHS